MFYINKRNNGIGITDNTLLIHMGWGILTGCLISFAVILLCAFILTLNDFDASVATPMANVCLAVGAGTGGFVSSVLHKSKGLVVGCLTGFIMFALITAISLLVSKGAFTSNTPLRLIVMPIIGGAGGIVGVNKTAKRKMI